MLKYISVLLFSIFAATSVVAEDKDIVDIAVGDPQFSTLVGLVQEAGLVETLKSEGPFTLFAPTNEAFAKVPASTLEELKADPAKLKKVLTYHVVPGQVNAQQVSKISSAKTVEGSELSIDTAMGVKINDAKVTKADISAANGIIHVVDTVLIPAS